jgi:hypothetical protein
MAWNIAVLGCVHVFELDACYVRLTAMCCCMELGRDAVI